MKTNTFILLAFFATAVSCFAEETEADRKWKEKVSEKNRTAVKAQREKILAEIETLKDHPWAGFYYFGDGLGTNVSLSIAPENGFAYTWSGCTGLYDQDYGEAIWEENHLKLSFTLENNRSENLYLPELIPVPWGERLYLVPSKLMYAFCNEINAQSEPRNRAHGQFFLRRDDWKKQVEGKPKLPEQYMPYLLDKPVNAEIIAVDESTNVGPMVLAKVTINKGKKDGLLPKMSVSVTKPNNVYTKIVLTEVEEDHASGIYRYFNQGVTKDIPPQTGWKVSTCPSWRKRD